MVGLVSHTSVFGRRLTDADAAGTQMIEKHEPNDISIGKVDILATYTYAKALLHGLNDDEAKQRGMVAAIMGAQARLGIQKNHRAELGKPSSVDRRRRKSRMGSEPKGLVRYRPRHGLDRRF
jgi:hypothetical protein